MTLTRRRLAAALLAGPPLAGQSSILNPEVTGRPLQAPSIASVPPDQVIARQAGGSNQLAPFDETSDESVTDEPKHSPKNDWL